MLPGCIEPEHHTAFFKRKVKPGEPGDGSGPEIAIYECLCEVKGMFKIWELVSQEKRSEQGEQNKGL